MTETLVLAFGFIYDKYIKNTDKLILCRTSDGFPYYATYIVDLSKKIIKMINNDEEDEILEYIEKINKDLNKKHSDKIKYAQKIAKIKGVNIGWQFVYKNSESYLFADDFPIDEEIYNESDDDDNISGMQFLQLVKNISEDKNISFNDLLEILALQNKINELNLIREDNPIKLKEDKVNELKEDKVNKIKEDKVNKIKEDKVNELKEDKVNEIKEDKVNELKEDKVNELKEDKVNELKEDKVNELKEDKVNELKESKSISVNEIKEDKVNEIKESKSISVNKKTKKQLVNPDDIQLEQVKAVSVDKKPARKTKKQLVNPDDIQLEQVKAVSVDKKPARKTKKQLVNLDDIQLEQVKPVSVDKKSSINPEDVKQHNKKSNKK
jgi:hypothetical protein